MEFVVAGVDQSSAEEKTSFVLLSWHFVCEKNDYF
jgi:hypothetical protein